ncbi:hypothetical protein LAP9435_0699 [Lactiplantibacillus plantarum]|nr:hypothetical protein LAP8962_00701 [Lactiplantibacillus plantarum]VFI61226.1 hypothetical protein LAP9434_00699 [Lactiplantibacillus plantarum]VFQ55777.1 hypothetical protein LAP9435_0699 [Lactiplantibacillus plantarum]
MPKHTKKRSTIKDRHGNMIDGVFVKNSDLEEDK